MARPRAADHDQQRAGIRANAVAAFARLGYASASMSDLAAACGVSKATLYHYFDSKETLLFECLDDYTRRLLSVTAPVNGRPASDHHQARKQLESLITELLGEYAQSRNYHISLLHDVKFLGDEQARLLRAQQRSVVGHIADLIDAAFPGRVSPPDRIPTTMSLLGMINFTFAWLDADGPMDHAAYAKLVIQLWFHGLSPLQKQ